MPLSIILAFCLLLTFQTKAEKAAEKERLKSPARITINAPAADVKALILTESVNSGWRLVSASESRLVFQRTPESMGQRLSLRFAYGGSAGNPPQQEIAYTLAPSGESVTVIADVAVVVQRFGGSIERYNWNADKTQRAFTDSFLTRVKKKAPKAQLGRNQSPPRNLKQRAKLSRLRPSSASATTMDGAYRARLLSYQASDFLRSSARRLISSSTPFSASISAIKITRSRLSIFRTSAGSQLKARTNRITAWSLSKSPSGSFSSRHMPMRFRTFLGLGWRVPLLVRAIAR